MRRALVLLLASAAALVGLVLLAVGYVGVGTRTLEIQQTGDSPCLQAYSAQAPGSHVRYSVFPPRSICTYDVGGSAVSVVVTSASPVASGLGAALALGGIAVCAGVLLAPRLRRQQD